jgi:hypothetical protein
MNLHANAALSLKGRRQLCRRVLEQGWTVTEAAQPDSTGADLASERQHARDACDDDVYGTAPHLDEISGFGSHATWRSAR